jgi:type I restriction enzyme S subunit
MAAIWKKKRLLELCNITSSKRIYATDYQSEGVPFYRGKEIIEKHKGNLKVSTELFILESKFNEIKRKFGVPNPGDLLLTSVGTLGVPYVVKPGEEFYFKDGNLIWFRHFTGLYSRFLYYWLLSPQGMAEQKKCTIGASQPAFTIVLLKDMEVDLPALPTQRKIAAILSAYDDLIQNNTRRIRILEEMAQLIYREWFVNFHFPGHEKVKMAESELGMIPEGWEVKKVGDVATLHRGKSYRSENLVDEGGLPFLNLKCIDRGGGFRYDGIKRFQGEFREEQTAKTNDIAIAVTDMTQERRLVAHAARVPEIGTQIAVMSMDLVRIEPVSEVPKEYLYGLFRFSSFPDEIKQHANGANVLHLNPERITDFKFVLAPEELRNQYSSICANLYQLADALHLKNANLRRTRDLLLPKLISGELDVENLDIDVGDATESSGSSEAKQ